MYSTVQLNNPFETAKQPISYTLRKRMRAPVDMFAQLERKCPACCRRSGVG